MQIISFQSFSLFFIEHLVNFKVFTYIYAVLFTFVHNGASYITYILWYGQQGSVLGPMLFLIYLLPLGILTRKHGLELIAYAVDTKHYIKHINERRSVAKMEKCLTDIYKLMSQNKLKLNADKTEVLAMGTPQMRAKKIYITSITVNGVIVPVLNESVGNLVLFLIQT